MIQRWGVLALLTVTLALAGCVRTAGTPFEPVSPDDGETTDISTPTELPVTPTEEMDADAQSADETEEADDTGDEIAITVIPPTATPLPILEVTDTPTAPATATTASADAQSATDDEEDATEEATSGSTAPTGPGGPVEIATNTPVPSPTRPAPAADLQPTPTSVGDTETAVGANVDDACLYVVRSGDNPYRIAVNNNVTLAALQQANPDTLGAGATIIQPGDEVVLPIPGCAGIPLVAQPDDTDTEETEDTIDVGPVDPTTGAPDGFIVYSVTSGDTLLAIARRFETTVDDLVEFNELASPDRLSIGQELFVPDPNIPPTAQPTPVVTTQAAG